MKRNKLYLMGILLAGAFLISCTGNGRNGTSDKAKDESIVSTTLETTLAAKVESDNVGSETITGNEDDKSVETSAEEKLSDASSQSKSDGKLTESSESETVTKDDGSGETVADAAESTATESKAPETEAAKSGKTKKKKIKRKWIKKDY